MYATDTEHSYSSFNIGTEILIPPSLHWCKRHKAVHSHRQHSHTLVASIIISTAVDKNTKEHYKVPVNGCNETYMLTVVEAGEDLSVWT